MMGKISESIEYWNLRKRREAMGYPVDPIDSRRETQVLSEEDTGFVVLFQEPIKVMGMAPALSSFLITLTLNLADRDPAVAKQKARFYFYSDIPLKSVIDQVSFFLVLCLSQGWSKQWYADHACTILDAIEMAERLEKVS